MESINYLINESKLLGLSTALLINEVEDLVKVNATEYPITINIPEKLPHRPYVSHTLKQFYPFLPIQQIFTSDLMVTTKEQLLFIDPLSLFSSKVMLLCGTSPRAPIKVHNRRIFQ